MTSKSRPRGRRSALLLVGIQNDLVSPSGALSVPDGEKVVEVINTLRSSFTWDVIVRAELAYPSDHLSFVSTSLRQGKDVQIGDIESLGEDGLSYKLLPSHCVSESKGAEPPEALTTDPADTIIRMGQHSATPACSAFRDLQATVVGSNMTRLAKTLKSESVTDVFVVGLGMEELVAQTAADARELNFSAHIVLDACKGWSQHAVQASRYFLESKGVEVLQSQVLLQGNPDRRSDAVAYIEENNIAVLFQQLTAELVYHKPDNPREFLIEALKKRQQSQAQLPRVSLLTDEDLSTMFDMLDPIGKGQVSGKQVMQGLKGLGMRPKDPVDPAGMFEVEDFKKVLMSAH